ncbi:hypothetical protein NC652_027972 [Populus alba x Populus x berolinensis]|nr:hypothetical protein NC652_027972 [Populus alba x Populus x berolinensis]
MKELQDISQEDLSGKSGAGIGFQAWFSVLGDVGFDGRGNIEWQNLLGRAAQAAISGIGVVAAVAQPTKRERKGLGPEPQNLVLNSRHIGGGGGGGKDRQSAKEHFYHHQQVLPFLARHQYLQNAQPQQDQNQHLYQGLDTKQQQPPLQPSKKRSYFPSSSSLTFQEQSVEYAGKMGESHHQAATSIKQQNISDEKEYGLSVENVATSKTAAIAEVQNTQQQMAENPNSSSGFLPPSLESDVIADTIKTFFPMGASTETSSPTIQFQNYPPDLMSRTSSQSQDLRLSLLSFQGPILLQHQAHHHGHQAQSEHQVFSGTTAHHLGFDCSSGGWSEQHHPQEITRFQRNLVAWNAADAGSGGGGSAGLIFNAPLPPPQTMPPSPLVQPFFGQNQFFSQRGTLQSSNSPSFRAWIDPAITPDHHLQQQQQQTAISGIGFTASDGEFYGFRVPTRIQGEEEERDGIHNKPSSASSDSRRLVHCLRKTNMGLRRCFQDRLGGWDFGHLEMNQSQIPWEKREIRVDISGFSMPGLFSCLFGIMF